MSSCEGDVIPFPRNAAGMYSLDATTKCAADGCRWHIRWADGPYCVEHGGRDALAWTDDEWGHTLYRGTGGGSLDPGDGDDAA